jgi:phage-related tail fiber protein
MPTFKTIHTRLGLIAMAQAEATGSSINLTQMAVGDGNGNATTPDEMQTTLVRELFRASINRVFQSPTEPNRFTAEIVIPATTGGFTMREIGVFDSDGTLFAVGNLPATYKPVASEGAYADTVVRMEFLVTNTSVVTLQVDPNVTVATRQWITNNITAATLIPGGTTDQILAKSSNADGAYIWKSPTAVNITVNSVEETQTLAAAQTVVNWATVSNTGLAVYIEGVRLRSDQFTKHPTINTRVTLAQAYPAGTKIIGAQNEPASTMPDPLVKGQNLADVPSKPTARTNLDVYSKAETDQKAPPGLVGYFGGSAAPVGWLKANGAAVSRAAYADLYAAIGTTFGAGDGFTSFNLPDLRGEFVRGWDDGRGVDSGRALGSAQGDLLKSHTHTFPNSGKSDQTGLTSAAGDNSIAGYTATTATGGSETRPRNIALLACVKY